MKNQSSILIQTLTNAMDKVSQANTDLDINNIIEKLIIDCTDSEFATLFLFDKKSQLLSTKRDDDVPFSVADTKSMLGEAFLTKTPSFYNHILSEKNYLPEIDNPTNLKLKSQIIVPILDDDNLIGIVKTARSIRYSKVYSRHEMELVSSLSPFMVKMIKILSSHKKSDYVSQIDTSKINQQIRETEKKDNIEVSKAMLLFANTVHDIRTPANSLFGFLELMEENTQDNKMKIFIENAKESAKFINTLTDSILEQTKQAHEMQTSKPTTVNSVTFFAKTANIFSANMANKDISYIIHIDPFIPKEIKVEELKLKRIIINLIGNAYKFTPKGKRIDFSVKFDKNLNKIKISVKDEGIGIDESRQKAVFEAFKQAESDTSEHFGGTGLGLSICAKYISELNGKLELDSALGRGSEFYFDIPVEVIDKESSYTKLEDFKKNIVILTDNISCVDANNIKEYMMELNMPSEKISVSNVLNSNVTHLFCFEHRINDDILMLARDKSVAVVFIEESLFSLTKSLGGQNFNIISENTYYGDLIYDTIFSIKKKKICIADDNKINIMLLKSMLETEHVETQYAMDGKETLDILKEAYDEDNPFDIIFLDKHMPNMSGTDVIKSFRIFEKENNIKSIYAISITGDSNTSDEERALYDLFVNKPFNKATVRESIQI